MKLSELVSKAKIEYSCSADIQDLLIDRIVYDSRNAGSCSLFVCIRGFASDGHDFAKRAYDMGCRAFVAQEDISLPDDAVVLISSDTRKALACICAAFYDFPARKLSVIGITGTKGKTTTALMLASILSAGGISCGYIGSNGIDFAGNHFDTKNTTPESLDLHYYLDKMVMAGCKAAVIEVSSQALYLDRVFNMDFESVVFTNLAPDHIGGAEHPTFGHYRDSKKKLFCEYRSKYCFYNSDDAASEYMLDDYSGTCISYGINSGDFSAENIVPFMENGILGVNFTLCSPSEHIPVRLPMPGDFNVYNALCAFAVASTYGIPAAKIARTLADTYVKGRFEVVKTPLPAVFIIDYAHNGFSLESALSTLSKYKPKRLICLIGSVGGRTVGRRSELGRAASGLADKVILTADNPDFEDAVSICGDIKKSFIRDVDCEIIGNRAEAVKFAVENSSDGDIVLFAGKGHEQYQLINGSKIPFSERRLIESFALQVSADKKAFAY